MPLFVCQCMLGRMRVDVMMPGYWRETVASEKYRKREEGISEASRVFKAMGGMEKGKVKINGKKIHT